MVVVVVVVVVVVAVVVVVVVGFLGNMQAIATPPLDARCRGAMEASAHCVGEGTLGDTTL